MNDELEKYIPLVNFLADTLGENTEIVLHDVRDCNQSIVAIRNGKISGRKIGSPMTDMGLKILKEAGQTHQDYQTGYHGISKDGKIVKGATYFIRDRLGLICGMLCINTDYSILEGALKELEKYSKLLKLSDQVTDDMQMEILTVDMKDVVDRSIKRIYKKYNFKKFKLSQKEKLKVVKELNETGTFSMKGSVAYVAERIGSSVPTIYRYLNSIKAEKK